MSGSPQTFLPHKAIADKLITHVPVKWIFT